MRRAGLFFQRHAIKKRTAVCIGLDQGIVRGLSKLQWGAVGRTKTTSLKLANITHGVV